MRAFLHFGIVALLLLAQSGVSVHQHYCQEQWMGSRLFLPAPSCHESSDKESSKKACPLHGSSKPGDRDCCNDRAVFVKADLDAWQFSVADLDMSAQDTALLPMLMAGTHHWPRFADQAMHVRINSPPPDYRLELPWLQRFNS